MPSRRSCFLVLFACCLAPVAFSTVAWLPAETQPSKKGDSAVAEPAKLLKTFVEEFVAITPGKGMFPESFEMGVAEGPPTEQPQHKVTFHYGFAIAKYEIPQNLYQAVMGHNPSEWKGPRNSAERFTWSDAVQFCEKTTALLHEQKLISEDEYIRLPTEAEWEYCCRAGTTAAYSFGPSATKPGDAGNIASVLNTFGWHTGNAKGNDPPVGALKPNPWGLYDMHGYLWEFVADPWHENYTGAPQDGSVWKEPDSTAPHTIRGGSWQDNYELLRSSSRRKLPVEGKSAAIGFRCVKAKRI